MNRILMGIAMGGPMFVGAQALPDSGRDGVSKHQTIVQIVDCVKKRVASRTVSYSEAIKACKEEAKGQAAASPPATLLASGADSKP
jgi:hypothetical protein